MGSRLDYSNFAGKKFHKLEAVDYHGSDSFGCIMWNFKCDCGNINPHVAYRVINGRIRSCGCSRKGPRNNQSILRSFYRDYKLSAKNRDLKFSISFEEFVMLVTQNCKYCGAQPSSRRRRREREGSVLSNGIDRIDNSRGYESGNCAPCCKICNMAKRELGLSEFMCWIKKLIVFNKDL